jgi:phosphoribosylformylglycinamidine synthase
MKYGIVVFPGSNCDHDAFYAVTVNSGTSAQFLWHKETNIPDDIDCIILPGGFSYGDYLRCGAIARFSPIMKEVVNFANKGKYVLGICNGFQILTEVGLLPGALTRNSTLKFVCKDVFLKVMNNSNAFTSELQTGDILKVPVAHGEGNYYAPYNIINELEQSGRVIFKYASSDGEIIESANPNGSLNNIAGIINEAGNVMGLMPHPERYSDNVLGCDDGLSIFNSINSYVNHLQLIIN